MTEIRIKIDQEKCKGCDLCINLCPKEVFKETEDIGSKGFKLREVTTPENCSNCGLCNYFCPEGAIVLNGESLLDEFWKKVFEEKEIAKKQNLPRGGWREVKTHYPGKYFLSGNIACVWAAIDAGCRFFAGYPITPANEQSLEAEKRMREVEGIFIQMENEDASLAALCGASLAGAKVMTATSGPGFSRMQENLSFALTNEIPLVIVDAQRAGPSTGRPTGTGAGEIREARWGSHGGTEHIVLYPSTVQEIYDYTIKAFNLAEKFRVPVILMLEASNAHLEENIEIPTTINVFDRIYKLGVPAFGPTSDDSIPSMPKYGEGEFLKVTGLTHNQWGVPCATEPEIHEKMVEYQRRKIFSKIEELTDVEEFLLDDAEIMFVAYGHTARACKWAIKEVREKGKKVGMLKLRTLYPFPEKKIEEWSAKAKCVLVPEMNQEQLFYVVRESSLSPVISLPQSNGESIDPRRILGFLERDLSKYYQEESIVPVSTFFNPPEWQAEIKGKGSVEKSFSFKTPFCAGCQLGVLRNCLIEVIKELKWDNQRVVVVSGIGCTARLPNHLPFDSANTTHGYPVAFATGIKLVRPDLHVIVVSGDGDLFNIGTGHSIHGAKRNIPISVICFNNMVFGLTGGQVAATTPFGAKTSTTPTGSKERPFDLIKLMLGANAEYVVRGLTSKPLLLKKNLKEAFSFEGFSFIEVDSPCLTQYARRNELGSPAGIIKSLNEAYISKQKAKKLSKEEIEERFRLLFPFRKDVEIREEELLQIVYGKFSSLMEYIDLIPSLGEEKG